MISFATSKNFDKYVRETCLIDKMQLRHNTTSIGPPMIRSKVHLETIQVKLPKSNEK